jgi:hypothetical protein
MSDMAFCTFARDGPEFTPDWRLLEKLEPFWLDFIEDDEEDDEKEE